MSNETKRDVFEDALRALEEFGEQGSSWEMAYDDLSTRYAAALPDDLPVIPKAVGEYIRWCKGKGGISNILDAVLNVHGNVENWIYNESNWSNSNVFAHAWVIGAWKVEETDEIAMLEDGN